MRKEHRVRTRAYSNRLLLLEDVYALGRKGDIVSVRPGYARNYLLPKKKAVVAEAHTLRMQARLQEERAKQAQLDREISDALAGQINGITLNTHVKIDPEGNMYGSVAVADVMEVLATNGLTVEKSFVQLPQAIKQIGLHVINLKLKEGVTCSFKLKVIPEGMEDLPEEAPPEPAPPEEHPAKPAATSEEAAEASDEERE